MIYLDINNILNDLGSHSHKGAIPAVILIVVGKTIQKATNLLMIDISPELLHWTMWIAYILAALVSILTIVGKLKKWFGKK